MDKDFWCDFVAGWIGGCVGLIVGHPLDTIKVRQQTLKKLSATTGIINTFKYEGVRGFYKGMGFPLLATGTLNSLFFGVYANTLRMLSDTEKKPSSSTIFAAGCAGGLVQLVVACPVDLVKIKMQMQLGSSENVWGKNTPGSTYQRPLSCLQDLYRRGGLAGCFSGLRSMVMRDVVASGIYVWLYEGLVATSSPVSIVCAGGVAGVLSWASILPLDVVKSRIQADCPTNPQYKSSWDCLVKSYRTEGLMVFTRGFWMMSIRAFPTNGAIFLGYVSSLTLIKRFASVDT